MDGLTLRPVLTDEQLFRAHHANDPALEVLVALWTGEPDEALVRPEPLLSEAPRHWRWRALRAEAWRDLGDHQRAVDEFRRLCGEHVGTSHEAVLVQHLGKAHFAAGDYESAVSCFERAVKVRAAAGAERTLIESSRAALRRARQLAATATPDQRPTR